MCTLEALWTSIGSLLERFSLDECKNYIRHCGHCQSVGCCSNLGIPAGLYLAQPNDGLHVGIGLNDGVFYNLVLGCNLACNH